MFKLLKQHISWGIMYYSPLAIGSSYLTSLCRFPLESVCAVDKKKSMAFRPYRVFFPGKALRLIQLEISDQKLCLF
jgi:hypothetical protein